MINKNTNDSDSFIYFLKWLMIDKQLKDNNENSKWWIIADDAKIHTWVKTQNWWKESKMKTNYELTLFYFPKSSWKVNFHYEK